MPITIIRGYKKIKRIPLPLWIFIWLKKKIFILKTYEIQESILLSILQNFTSFPQVKQKFYSISMKLNASGTMQIMKVSKIQSNFQNILISMNPALP